MDGLVTNLALVAGVGAAGAAPRFIVLTGLAGLIAGAFSMAMGEYTSVRTQKEQVDREWAKEAAEIRENSAAEERELATMFASMGMTETTAAVAARDIHRSPAQAALVHLTHELGLDQREKPSPMVAAISSVESRSHGDDEAEEMVDKPMTGVVTPMLFLIIAFGYTDLLFALDSIPVIYGLTQEPYLVFAANVFALMGLRQLYFLMGGVLHKLVYLSLGLSVILAFIGVKLIIHALHAYQLSDWAPFEGEIPSGCRSRSSSPRCRSLPSPVWSSPAGTRTTSARKKCHPLSRTGWYRLGKGAHHVDECSLVLGSRSGRSGAGWR